MAETDDAGDAFYHAELRVCAPMLRSPEATVVKTAPGSLPPHACRPFLLDTQCWLWMTLTPDRLSASARAQVEAGDTELYLSGASAWEIAVKDSIGRLRLPEPPPRYVPSRLDATGTTALPIEHGHALHVATLPPHHRDPFDRLLIAQAQLEDLPILTADPIFERYEVTTIAAA